MAACQRVAHRSRSARVHAGELSTACFSTDDFAYCGYPPHLGPTDHEVPEARRLRRGGVLCRLQVRRELATAFASSFAEPQIRAHGDLLQFFTDAGLALEADEDLTDEFLDTARTAFKTSRRETCSKKLAAVEVPLLRVNWRGKRRPGVCALQLLAHAPLGAPPLHLAPSGRRRGTAPAQAENANAPAG